MPLVQSSIRRGIYKLGPPLQVLTGGVSTAGSGLTNGPVVRGPSTKRTQEDQDEEDEEKQREAILALVQTWMDSLQLISVIVTFFVVTEATLLGMAVPPADASLSATGKAANVGLIGALVIHTHAGIISFLAAFFLIRYKFAVAQKEEKEAKKKLVQDLAISIPSNDVETARGSRSSPHTNDLRTDPIQGRVRIDSSLSGNKVIRSANPHLVQVGPFQPPTLLLQRCHSLCVFLSFIGFVLALIGTISFAWDRLPLSSAENQQLQSLQLHFPFKSFTRCEEMAQFSSLIDQSLYLVPSFTLECGWVLKRVPIAYKTWGKMNETKDNVMIICHAFTGSADVEDWWGPLMGRGKAFDSNRFFIICANTLGSPYGSASPVTINPDTARHYGPEFPPTTIRDDVRIHKLVLDYLGVRSVAVVIGGSMGGMTTLEWPLCTPPGYVRRVIPLATSARHSAWCISWGEAQRQSIYSDPGYEDGFYTSQPASGLAAARMSALLTYRSRDSFESRFGRKPQINKPSNGTLTPPASPKSSEADEALAAHNDGLRNPRPHTSSDRSSTAPEHIQPPTPQKHPIFSAQSYLRYQGDKFTSRFDANCYIHITRKLDTHDVARDRVIDGIDVNSPLVLSKVLSTLPPCALVISIATDGLFTTSEQRELADHIPQAELVVIPSPDGHDGFLLEFEQINTHILRYLKREFSEYYDKDIDSESTKEDFTIQKTSVFGEAEVDVARW